MSFPKFPFSSLATEILDCPAALLELYIVRDRSGPPHCCTGVGQGITKFVLKHIMLWFFEAAFSVSACTELLDCVTVQIIWLNLTFSAMEFYFLIES